MSTRDRLLASATTLFAKSGFDTASTDAIVRAAKVTKRMLYHYFGDKDGLVREVMVAQWQTFALAFAEAEWQGSIEKAVDAFFDFAASHPQFLRLLMWDALSGSRISQSLWADVRQPLFEQTLVLLGVRSASAKQREALAQKVVTFLGAVTFYFAFAPALTDVLGADPLSPASLRKRRAHLQHLLAALMAE